MVDEINEGDQATPDRQNGSGHDETLEAASVPEKRYLRSDGGTALLKKVTLAATFLAGAAVAGGIAAAASLDLGDKGKVVADPSPSSSASPWVSPTSSPSISSSSSSTSSTPSSRSGESASSGTSSSSSNHSQASDSTSTKESPTHTQPSQTAAPSASSKSSSSVASPTQIPSPPSHSSEHRDSANSTTGSGSKASGSSNSGSISVDQSRINTTWRSHIYVLRSGQSRYLVQPGDTLSQLALAMGVRVEDLARVNGIDDPDRIYAGQSLKPVRASGF